MLHGVTPRKQRDQGTERTVSMKILLAADGSRFTQVAARYLVSHLQWFAKPPEVHVLHVHPSLPYPGAAASANALKTRRREKVEATRAVAQKDLIASVVEEYQRSESEAALAVAQKELLAGKIPHTSAWMVGDVALQLSKYVEEHAIDLVIMGTHGQGALANLALGSVVTKCIASLEVPIIVVRNAPAPLPLTRRERTYGRRTRKPDAP